MKKEIELDDYFLINNDTDKELEVKFLDYFEYLLNKGFNDLETYVKNSFNLNEIPKVKDRDIIKEILVTSHNDFNNKKINKKYYIYNVVCLLKTIKRIYNNEFYNYLKSSENLNFMETTYSYILKAFLLDLDQLINLYNINITKTNKKYRSNIGEISVQYYSVHNILRQSLYGNFSCHSFSDMEISASISVIRQLIELRLRRAFGLISYIDKNDNVAPLNLSLIFNVLKKYKSEIKFPIAIDNIERIYKWANSYVHSGKAELSWIPYYIEYKLRELSFGKMDKDGLNVENGIVTSEDTIKKIHDELEKKDYKIYTCKPECKIRNSK